MAEEIVIRAQGLTKRYGTTIAVDHIDLDVRAGRSSASWGRTDPARRRRS